MEADFSGWATKAGLKCSDGRTIMPNAFQHQDQARVPLVWQHGHSDPENVLGHAILENRPEGVYAYGFFNNSAKAVHAKGLVEHKDINALSIWANQLIERSKSVIHGQIRELSLVLSGANPGALIENVTIAHSDGEVEEVDEAIITTGLELEHSDYPSDDDDDDEIEIDDDDDDDEISHDDLGPDATVQDVYDSLTDEQKTVVDYMIGEALASQEPDADDAGSNSNDASHGDTEGNNSMKHNVFDQSPENKTEVLSHDALTEIVGMAKRQGSLKHAVEEYALAHGIENIGEMFPEARLVNDQPDFVGRRVEWVATFLGAARKSPFARIKTISADITEDEARAKGYITGSLKKEEFFAVAKRTTVPTTVYKKQKIDRDDIIDITDFDVITWLQTEMRVMLDEEVARAALFGDGRDISNEDKIDEQCIRPIATDNELFTTTINVQLNDSGSSASEIIDAIVFNRWQYRGTGLPTMFTTETVIAQFLMLKDTTGRRIYASLDEVATELRVSSVVPVEAMENTPWLAILVNPVDYVFGTDKGGEVNMFDFFDIDYNNMKYLMETRCSGALVKPRSALVVVAQASGQTLVTPAAPSFNPATGVLTINDTSGVVYKNGTTVVNNAGSPYAAIAAGTSVTITATPATGHFFTENADESWTFTRDA